jgi:type I restriction enzyme R subunit
MSEKLTWHTEKRKLKDLVPYERNPRKADEKQVGDVNKSITKFGLAEPLVINTDGTMIREPQRKYFVNNVPVEVINERVQYMGEDGKLITESLKDYTKKNILTKYRTLDEFLNVWTASEKKNVIIEELEKQGVLFDALDGEVGKDLDPFDLICHVAFGKKPLTRKERAENVKKRDYFAKYEGKAREVINALLDKYADNGITAIDDIEDLSVSPFPEFGTPLEIVNDIFGGRDNYLKVVKKIEESIYAN